MKIIFHGYMVILCFNAYKENAYEHAGHRARGGGERG